MTEKFMKTHLGKQFIVFNQVINKESKRVLGFMSPSLLAVLKFTEEWNVDGTFNITM